MKYDEQVLLAAIDEAGGFQPAARLLRSRGFDISDRTLRRYFSATSTSNDFELEVPMLPKIDIKELIDRRVKQFEQKKARFEQEKLIPVKMNIDGPIGIGFMGDPHVDDDGTDLKQLYEHADLFDGRNKGLFATNLGDVSNNWSGKLARLWAEQSTSANESKAIVTDFLGRVNWLFYIHGNHDKWSNGTDLLNEILRENTLIAKDDKIRTEIKLPNGKSFRIYAVHGFAGKSMWSEVYGAAKKAQMDGEHHDIYVAGHIHTSGYTHGMRPSTDQMWHALQVASYKKIDRYAEELNLDSKDLYNCPVALIDPYASNQVNFIRFEFDPHEGAERLKWMRQRFEQGKSSS